MEGCPRFLEPSHVAPELGGDDSCSVVEDELPESVEKYAGANFYFRVCNLTDAIMKDDGRSQEPILCTEGS